MIFQHNDLKSIGKRFIDELRFRQARRRGGYGFLGRRSSLNCRDDRCRERLPKLRPPTLILAGDDDPIIPVVNGRIMNWLIPRSQLQIYHGGHLELAADAGSLASAIEAFLDADLIAEESQQ